MPRLDRADTCDLVASEAVFAGRAEPRPPRGVSCLDQPSARAQCRSHAGQSRGPLLVDDEYLRHVAGHRREVTRIAGREVASPCIQRTASAPGLPALL